MSSICNTLMHCYLWRCPEAGSWSSSSNILCFSFTQRPVPCHGRRGKRGSTRNLLCVMKCVCVLQHDFKAELGVRAAVIVWETQGWTQVQYSWSSMLNVSIINTQGWTQVLFFFIWSPSPRWNLALPKKNHEILLHHNSHRLVATRLITPRLPPLQLIPLTDTW